MPPPPSNALVSDPGGDAITNLRISGGYLYWFGGQTRIARAPISGGAPATLFTHPTRSEGLVEMGGLAVDETGIYFSDTGATSAAGIFKMPLDGGSAPVRIATATQPYQLAAQGDDLCFEDAGDIRHVSRAGGAGNTLVRAVGDYATKLVVAGSYCYFQAAMGGAAENLWRVPLTAIAAGADGGTDAGASGLEKVSVVPGRYDLLLAPLPDAGFVYWAAGDSVFRASTTTSAKEVANVVNLLDVMNQGSPDILYATANTIYWGGGGPFLWKRAVDSDALSRIETDAQFVRSLTADDRFLYVAVGAQILKLAK